MSSVYCKFETFRETMGLEIWNIRDSAGNYFYHVKSGQPDAFRT